MIYYGNDVSHVKSGSTFTWSLYVDYEIIDSPTQIEVHILSGIYQVTKGSFKITEKEWADLTISGDMSFQLDDCGAINLTGKGFMKQLSENTFVFTKGESAVSKSASITLSVTGGSWQGDSTYTLNVSVPPASKPIIALNCLRCNAQGEESGSGEYAKIELSATRLSESCTLNTPTTKLNNATITPTYTFGGDTVTFPHTMTNDEETYIAIYPISFVKDSKFDITIADTTTLIDTTVTDTVPLVVLPYWKVTATVNATSLGETFVEPEYNQNGKARIKVYAKNTSTNVYDEIVQPDGWEIVMGNNSFTVSVMLGENYVSNPDTLTTSASVKVEYDTTTTTESDDQKAFFRTTRNINFANGLANCVFVGGCTETNHSSRVWYSAVNDPLYFPDDKYIEVGSNDKSVMGLVKVGSYLGIVKQGTTYETSIYLAYATSFDDDTTYAVKQGVSGIGAVSRYCFNTLNDEVLFLSEDGIMAIEPSEDDDHKVKDRGYYLNGKMLKEDLESAYSIVYDGKYFMALPNGHCYVLDGNQRNSWGNDKTNLVYEGYYLENIPAKNFVKCGNELWFCDFNGNICRFNDSYTDAYGDGTNVPVKAEWSTIFDDDGYTNYFKTTVKKGSVVSILPCGDSTVDIYAKVDEKPVVQLGTLTSEGGYPKDFHIRKKFRKYKRLQYILKSDLPTGFGIDSIITMYTIGSYSK